LPVLSETPTIPKVFLAAGNWEPAAAFSFFAFPRSNFDIYSAPGSKKPSGFASFVADEFEDVRRARLSTCPREAQMFIRDLLKNQVIISAEVHQTVLEVAGLMADHHIGAVPVLEGGQMVGIFSERDLMNRVVVAGRDPARTSVGQVMTDDPLTVAPDDPLETCMTLMKRHGFRHLPVCAGRELKGVVSLRDLLLHDLDEKDDEVRMMRAYLHSMPDAG
jgi:CBS domain-containing protein